MIFLKRVYEKPAKTDGYRILVDRLWPRGLSKENAKVDFWFKELAPSDSLRKWFHHEEGKWEDFKRKYLEELNMKKNLLEELREYEKKYKVVTLVYGAKDTLHNQAVILRELLTTK